MTLLPAVIDHWFGWLIVGYALVTAAVLLVCRCFGHTRLICGLWLAISIGVLCVARIPSVFENVNINPDEPQMIASAMKFTTDFLPWRSVDLGSVGPFTAMALMWPRLFGGDITIAAARITSVACMAGAWLCIWHYFDDDVLPVRITVCGSLMLFLAGTRWYDYVHYSTEHLAVLLTAAAGWITVALWRRALPYPVLFLSGLLLGSMPYGKLQSIPIALALGLVQVMFILSGESLRKARLRSLSSLLLGAVTPTLVIVGALAVNGEIREFWVSFVEWSLFYVHSPAIAAIVGSLTYSDLINLFVADQLYEWYFIACAAVTLSGIVLIRRGGKSQRLRYFGAALVVLLAALYAAIQPGLAASHYLILLLVPVALVTAAAWTDGPPGGAVWYEALTIAGSAGLVAISLFATPVLGRAVPNFAVVAPENLMKDGDLFSWLPPHQGGLVAWGWGAEWYVFSGLTPATRDVNSYNQLTVSPLLGYFRARFIRDWDKSPPAVLIDTPALGSSVYRSQEEFGAQVFPELQQRLNRDYVLVSPAVDEASCPRTWVRKDVFAAANRTIAPIRSIEASSFYSGFGGTFSPNAVDDWTSYETSSCLDRWLLPDGKLGSITLDLVRPEVITAVRILNIRAGPTTLDYRATLTARVQVLDQGRVVFATSTRVRRYPTWTVVGVPATLGDEVRIDVTAFEGQGGGLDEVQVSTAPSP